MNTKLRFLGSLLLFLLSFSSLLAQDDQFTLRSLADQNEFYIGTAVATPHLNNPDLANIIASEFSMLTPEYEAKFCELQPQPDRFDFTRFDTLMEFAEANNLVVRGHTLLWHNCVPSWLETGEFTREEAIQLLRDYIMTVVGRYRGRIAYWDVVNEGIDDDAQRRQTVWQRLIGDDYIDLAFQFAHEADPNAILFYNDYGAEGINAKSNAIYELVSDMVSRGVPIQGVGLQGHFTVGDSVSWVSPTNLNRNIDRLGELGLEVHITELDIRHTGVATADILEQQARDYYSIAHTCVTNVHCSALITWGVSDRDSWLRANNIGFFENPDVEPLMFDVDYAPKQAYYAVADVFREQLGLEPLTNFSIPEEINRVVEIPEPTKSDEAQLAPDSFGGAVYYAAFPVSIALDGSTDDWVNVPRVTITEGPLLPVNHDTALTFAVVADAEYLYLLAEVKDSSLVYGNYDTAEWYREDSVEFYLNTTGDLEASVYQDGIVQIGILAANLTQPDSLLLGGGNSQQAQVDAVVVETDEGYIVEASVPLQTDVWTIQPTHEAVIGFQAHLNGSSGDDRDTKLIWSVYDTTDRSWENPSLFGQLIFWDISQ